MHAEDVKVGTHDLPPPGTHGQWERQEAERLLTGKGADEGHRRKTFSLDFGAMLGLGWGS